MVRFTKRWDIAIWFLLSELFYEVLDKTSYLIYVVSEAF